MHMVNDDEKPSLEDSLTHFGVKGMKWGVRKDRSGGNSGGSAPKKKPRPSNDAVKAARARNDARQRELRKQADKVNLAKPGKQQADAYKKFAKMKADVLKNPDTAMSARMTNGEKAAMVALGVLVPGIGTTAAVIGSGAQVGYRKSLERRARKLNG